MTAFDLDVLLHLEQTFYDAGYADGFEHGRIHGLIEGRALGREKGFEIWEEIGFYEGFAETWTQIYQHRHVRDHDDQDQRAAHHIKHLLDLIRQFPTVNPSATSASTAGAPGEPIDMAKLQTQIRSRYKALCATLGVRPSLRTSSAASASPRVEIGIGTGSTPDAVVAQGGPGARHPQRTRASTRDVWTLEEGTKHPTTQGLSF